MYEPMLLIDRSVRVACHFMQYFALNSIHTMRTNDIKTHSVVQERLIKRFDTIQRVSCSRIFQNLQNLNENEYSFDTT